MCMCACFVEVCVIVYVCTYECYIWSVVCMFTLVYNDKINKPTNYLGTTVMFHNRIY